MAKTISEILNKDIKSVKDLKNAIKEYQDSLVVLDKDSEEYSKTVESLATAQDELTKVTKAGKNENIAAKDSIVGMEQEYKKLYNTYKLMTEEMRNSEAGKKQAEEMAALSESINNAKMKVGDFHNNVGRYSTSIMDAFTKMSGSIGGSLGSITKPLSTATNGIMAFNTTLKANPVMAVVQLIMSLIQTFQELSQGVAGSEEQQDRFNQAMAAFKPLLDAVSNGVQELLGVFVDLVSWLGQAYNWFKKTGAAITDFLHITKGAKDAVEEEIQQYANLEKKMQDINKRRREAKELNAEQEKQVAELKEMAMATEDAAEKEKYLAEAKAIQEEIDNRNIEIARDYNEALQEQATLTDNDAAMQEKLAEAAAAVSQAEETAANNSRAFTKQLNTVKNSANSAGKSLKNYREEAKKIYEQSLEGQKSELTKITEKYEKEKALLVKYGYDTTALTKQFTDEVTKINKTAQATQVEALKNYYKQVSAMDKSYRESLVTLFGEYSNEVLDYDTKKMDEKYEEIAGLTVYVKQTVDGLKTYIRKNGVGDAVLDAVGAVSDAIDTELDILKEKWDGIELEPLPTIEFLPDDTLEQTKQKIDEWIGYVDKFVLKSNTMAIEMNKDAAQNFLAGQEFINGIEQRNTAYQRFLEDRYALDTKYTKLTGEEIAKTNRERLEEDVNFLEQLLDDESERFYEYEDKINSIYEGRKQITQNQYTQRIETTDNEEEKVRLRQELNDKLVELENERNALITANEEASYNYRLQYEQDYYDKKAEMRDLDLEGEMLNAQRISEVWTNSIGAITQIGSSIQSIIGTFNQLAQAEIQSGKLTDKEVEKKKKKMEELAEVTKWVSYVSITSSAAASIMDIWKGYASEMKVNAETAAATGPAAAVTLAGLNAKSLASAILKTAGIGANAAAQIAAARGNYISTVNSLQESGGGTSVSAEPVEMDTNYYTYTRTLQTQDEADELNRPIWVSVQDINAAQNQVKVSDQESRF